MYRIVIVGGGVIGLLTARELRLSGAEVTVVERQQPVRESSWAGGGIVSPLFPWRYLDSITHLASWSQKHYPEICQALLENTRIDPQYTVSGIITVTPEDADYALSWAKQFGHRMEALNDKRYKELEPAGTELGGPAVFMPDVAQVRNPRITQALLAEVKRLGVEVISDSPVTGLQIENGQCKGVITDKHTYQGDTVVVAAGAWTGDLLKDLTPPDVQPVRGQMILFDTPVGTIKRMVLEANRYVIPRQDGLVLFGSTIEHVGYEKETTQEAYDELYQIATERFPVLKQYPVVKHWAGLRPSSPAGVPYIGPHPDVENLFVNAGHFRNGVVLGPASGRLMSDLVLDKDPIVDPSPYGWTTARG